MAGRAGAVMAAVILLLVPVTVFLLMPPSLTAPGASGRWLDAAAFVPLAQPRSAPSAGPQPAGAGDARQDFERALGAWENTTPRNPLQYR
jgi:hypothetical protein